MKKKIVIFTSTGGGGHLTVSNALEQELSNSYDVKQTLILGDILKKIDPAQMLTFGYLKGEDAYNYLVKNQWNVTLNTAMKCAMSYFSLRSNGIKKLLKKFLEQQQPQLIISVFHLFNRHILDVAEELDIPFILAPTDLDALSFVHNIHDPRYNKFRFALPFANDQIRQKIESSNISDDKIVITGFPLQKTFFENKDRHQIKMMFNVSDGKPIILVLMGAQGSKAMLQFAQQLSSLKHEAHIIFCLGKNEKIKEKINQIHFPSFITYSCIGFTNAISDLMNIADIIISKSGTVSVCEALYSNLPMILDATHKVLAWEQFNHQFITSNGFGTSLSNPQQLCSIINEWLQQDKLDQYKKNLQAFEKKRGAAEIKKIIESLI